MKKRPTRTLSTREILRIQTRVERETSIRQVGDIKANPDIYIYHGILPAAAKDETDRDVFVKVLLSHDKGKRAQFERESWICSHFRHDHLIRKEFSRTISLGGAFKHAKMIVLEYIDGIDAAELLDYLALSGIKLKSALVVEIGIKILKALDEVHSLNDQHGKAMPVVHADVSPQNILLSRKGQVKLIDFGIARMTGNTVHNHSPPRAGKPGYIAPEQIYAPEFDHRADLYAAGVVIAELLIGRRLAISNDLEDGRRADLSKIYQERIREAKLDAKLRGILIKAIDFESEKRHVSAKEFIQSLECYAQGKHMVFHSDGIPGTVSEVLGYFSDLETRQSTSREKQISDEKVNPTSSDEKTLLVEEPKSKRRLRFAPLLPYIAGVICAVVIIGFWKYKHRSVASENTQIQFREIPETENISEKIQKPAIVTDIEKPVSLPVSLKQIEPPPKPAQKISVKKKTVSGTGTLFVGASPWAEITIPGYVSHRSIPFTVKLREGWHKVSARYQDENGKWRYLTKSVRISPHERMKCLAFFEGQKKMTCR